MARVLGEGSVNLTTPFISRLKSSIAILVIIVFAILFDEDYRLTLWVGTLCLGEKATSHVISVLDIS